MSDRKPITPPSDRREPKKPYNEERGYQPTTTVHNPRPPRGGSSQSD